MIEYSSVNMMSGSLESDRWYNDARDGSLHGG